MTAARVDDLQDLGRALASYRAAAGLTQVDLARLTGVDVQYLSRMERGLAARRRASSTDVLAFRRLFTVLDHLGLRMRLEQEER